MKAPAATQIRRLGRLAGVAMLCLTMFGTGEVRACARNSGLDGPRDRIFELKLEDGKVPVDLKAVRVLEGDMVHLRWTSDRPLVLHLRGYDIEKSVAPGAVTEFAFMADVTGRFPITAGGSAAAPDGAAPVYLEVYPR